MLKHCRELHRRLKASLGRKSSFRVSLRSALSIALLLFAVTAPLYRTEYACAQTTSRQNLTPISTQEIVIRYSYVTGEEPIGVGVDSEYAEVAALTFQDGSLTPDQVSIKPLFPDVVDEMRRSNVHENVAILALAAKYTNSSRRFLQSTFFEALSSERKSRYRFSQFFVARFPAAQPIRDIITRINQRRAFFRGKNLIVRALPVFLTPPSSIRISGSATSSPEPLTSCHESEASLAIIADQFTRRSDLPKVTQVSLVSGLPDGCDEVPYLPASESYGTNVVGVASQLCPHCRIIALDAGCGSRGVNIIRSVEGAQAALLALLRGASVIVLPIADTSRDALYDEVLLAASHAGVAVVAPAGDESGTAPRYPAASKGIISVGATGIDGGRAEFSNYGSWLTTSALGVGIATTHKEGSLITASGTAFSAVRTAALMARYLGLNSDEPLSSLMTHAKSGMFSLPIVHDCPQSSGGGSITTPGSGSANSAHTGSNSNSSPGASAGNGQIGGGDPSSSGDTSGSGTEGSGSQGGSAPAFPSATPETAGGPQQTQPGSIVEPKSLATLAMPDSVSLSAAGVSPFELQQIQTALFDSKVNISLQGVGSRKVARFVPAKTTSAHIVYRPGTQAEEKLGKFQKLGEPTELDRARREFAQVILIPRGVDVRKEFEKVPGLVGVYVQDVQPKPIELPQTRTLKSLTSTSEAVTTSSIVGSNETALAEMGWTEQVREFTQRFTEKAKVAVISTGLDYERPELRNATTKNLLVTSSFVNSDNRLVQGNSPIDTDGFGTEVASLIAHERLGIAASFVELIPIKVALSRQKVGIQDLIRGISLAINKGAEIILLPHFFNEEGCNPVLGHAVYRAREKGVLVVTAAGDGLINQAGQESGYPVVPARDDGPASYELTSSPACWSRYFLGVVSAAASQGFGNLLSEWSNYGDAIELSAMGTGIDTVGLRNTPRKVRGTAMSAAWTTGAVALALAHHKTLKMTYAPWYLENLLVASAKRDPNSMQINRRNRFGSLLHFSNLMNLLIRAESLTESQRRNDPETINPRQDDGWKPGEDKSSLKYVTLSVSKAEALPGESIPYKVVAYFRDGSELDVTNDATNTRISTQLLGGTRFIEVTKPGVLKVAEAEAFRLFKGIPSVIVSANYAYEQAQGFGSAVVEVRLKPGSSKVSKLNIKQPGTPVRVGQEINIFKAEAEYGDGTRKDVTGVASWSTSVPGELRLSAAPGIFDARNAIAGKSYTVSATVDGVEARALVPVAAESVKSFYVHNYLGSAGVIERGQKVTLEARVVLSSASGDREQAIDAQWYADSTPLNSGARSRSLIIDTSSMKPGRYTYRADSVFQSVSGSQKLSNSVQIVVREEIARVEIHLKTPIVSLGQPFFIDLRSYRHNNSYTVVTEQASWSTSAPQHVTINRSGVGFASPELVDGSFAIRSEYKGKKAEVRVAAIRGSVVTGSSSRLEYLTLDVTMLKGPDRYCYPPKVQAQGKYKDGQIRKLELASTSFAEQDDTGAWRDARFPLLGGKTYRASVTYNDGTVASGGGGNASASTLFTMPTEPLDKILFNRGQSGPAVIFRNANSNQSFVSSGVCAISALTATPAGLAVGGIGTQSVTVRPGATGSFSVQAQGIYTGMGKPEVKEGAFRVEVRETGPTKLTILKESRVGDSKESSTSSYGRFGFTIQLLDEKGNNVNFLPSDVDIQMYEEDRLIDWKAEPRIRVFRSGSSDSTRPTSQETISVNAYTQSLGRKYTVQAVHKPTQLTATQTVVTAGSWEVRDSTPWSLPSEAPSVRNATVHPACERYLKAPTGLEFAGGNGTAADPLIICDAAQLLALGMRSPLRSKYSERTNIPWPKKDDPFNVRLGSDIDFGGKRVVPASQSSSARSIALDGDMHTVSNYSVIDSEAKNQALLGDTVFHMIKNLIIDNPSVRGKENVAALSTGVGARLENVTIVGGTVWGERLVGGAVVYGGNLKNVRVLGTEIRYETGNVGGVAATVSDSGEQLLFSGRIAPAGVPGTSFSIGGIVGSSSEGAVISNALMTGDAITLSSNSSNVDAGGIVGFNRGFIVNALMRGNLVSTGSGVGGIAGRNYAGWHHQPNHSAFGLDGLAAGNQRGDLHRRGGAIVRAKVEGNVWGGMGRQQLECIDKVAHILGVGGGKSCIGDIKSQTGGRSDVGGIAGVNAGIIQESELSESGAIYGISAVGGIAGTEDSTSLWVGNYVRNRSAGIVSASEGGSASGALLGRADFLFGVIQPRFDRNTVIPRAGNPSWTVGTWGKTLQAEITSNTPDHYGR